MYTGSPKRLRDARIAAGFASAAAAARAFGWGEALYRHHENGTRPYGAKHAASYAQAFHIKPPALFDEFVDSDDIRPLVLEGLALSTKEQRLREMMLKISEELDIVFVVGWSNDFDYMNVLKSVNQYAFSRKFLEEIFPDFQSKGISAFVTEDDSMGVSAPRGSLLLIDLSNKEPKGPDGIWLISVDGIDMVRRLNVVDNDQIELRADGSNARATTVNRKRVLIQGEVKWIGKRAI